MNRTKITIPTVLARGWKRQCPRCAKGPLFSRWINRFEKCEQCGYIFEENDGDLWAFWVLGDRVFVIFALIFGYLISDHMSAYSWSIWLARAVIFIVLAALLIATMPQRMGVCIAVEFLFRGQKGVTEGET